MPIRLARWRPGHLLLAWCGYWAALVLALVVAAMPALRRLASPARHGNISVGFDDAGFKAAIVDPGGIEWSRHLGWLPLSLLVAVPPLVLWALWLRAKGRERQLWRLAAREAEAAALNAAPPPAADASPAARARYTSDRRSG